MVLTCCSCAAMVCWQVAVIPAAHAWRIGRKTSLPPIVMVIRRTSSTGVALPLRSSSSASAPGSCSAMRVTVVAPLTDALSSSNRQPSALPFPQLRASASSAASSGT